jgi:hypothetical protein
VCPAWLWCSLASRVVIKSEYGSVQGGLTSSFLGLSREMGNDEITDSGHFWPLLALCYQGDVCDMSPYLCVPHNCGALWRLVWS